MELYKCNNTATIFHQTKIFFAIGEGKSERLMMLIFSDFPHLSLIPCLLLVVAIVFKVTF